MRLNVIYTAVLYIFIAIPYVAAESKTIGAMSELTGRFARLGEDCLNGYRVAEANSSYKPRIVFGDNQSDPKVGVSEFRRLLDQENASLVVTTRSPIGLAINPISKQLKIPLIGVVGHPKFVTENPFAFRAYPSTKDEARVLASLVNKERARKMAIISVEDDYFVSLSEEFQASLAQSELVFSESVHPTDTDFAPIVVRMRARKPEAIFLNIAPTQIEPFVKKLKELGLELKIFTNFLAAAPDIISSLGDLGNGIKFVEVDYKQSQFLDNLEKIIGNKNTSPIGYCCFVAMTLALKALEQSEIEETPVFKALSGVTSIDTGDQVLSIVSREIKLPVSPRVIRNGAIEDLPR